MQKLAAYIFFWKYTVFPICRSLLILDTICIHPLI